MAKHVTIRLPEADLEALRDALATGEGIPEAASKVAAAEEFPVTLITAPGGSTFRVTSGKPAWFLWPQLTTDGMVSVPIVLGWLKGRPITEARGTFEHARELIRRLQEITDGPT